MLNAYFNCDYIKCYSLLNINNLHGLEACPIWISCRPTQYRPGKAITPGGVHGLPGGGGDLVPTMSGCVCPKVKDMGSFSASRE